MTQYSETKRRYPSSVKAKTKLASRLSGLLIFSAAFVIGFVVSDYLSLGLFQLQKKQVPIPMEVRVVDGDSLVLDGNLKVRLKGIDAPELKQRCKNRGKESFVQCGLIAKAVLEDMVLNRAVSCTDEGKDLYQRQLSYCYVKQGGHYVNINLEMVKQGYAYAYLLKGTIAAEYKEAEQIARNDEIGLWKLKFDKPWEWRKRSKNMTGLTIPYLF